MFNANVLRCSSTSQAADKSRKDMIVLASTNQTVRTLNERKAASQAAANSVHLVTSHAMDSTNVAIDKPTRKALLCYNGRGDTKVGMGRIPLYIGMAVVYRGPNQSIALGVTNGAFGTITGWSLKEDNLGFTIPIGVIVQFDSTAAWALTGLDPSCLPIYPTSSTFTYALGRDVTAVRRISRRQLPLQPGFAMTVHSAQGVTCKTGVVVDLRHEGFPAYVAASRATRREDIHLIAEVTTTQLNTPPLPHALRSELKRLQLLAVATNLEHGGDTWRLTRTTSSTADNVSEDAPSKRRRLSWFDDYHCPRPFFPS